MKNCCLLPSSSVVVILDVDAEEQPPPPCELTVVLEGSRDRSLMTALSSFMADVLKILRTADGMEQLHVVDPSRLKGAAAVMHGVTLCACPGSAVISGLKLGV